MRDDGSLVFGGFDCEFGVPKEALRVALGLDVVDASTAFGTGNNVSGTGFIPQAIYSYD